MSKKSHTKGKHGELEWCRFLKAHGFHVERELNQPRDGGADVLDWPFAWQVKRTERLRPYTFMMQAWEDWLHFEYEHEGEAYPIVAMRSNHQPWLVVMYADDFLSWRKRHALQQAQAPEAEATAEEIVDSPAFRKLSLKVLGENELLRRLKVSDE